MIEQRDPRAFLKIEDLPEVLTAEDIAQHMNCAPQTIYVLFRKDPSVGGIPSYGFGRNKRADKADFVKWKAALKKKS